MMENPAKTMMIAGGGTGGHLFPGMAVAEEYLSRGPDRRVFFMGTAAGIEARRAPDAGYEFVAIRSRGIAGKGLAGKIAGAALVPLSLLDAVRALRARKPGLALGVGGFVSGPAVLAARLLGIPCAIQEQNAVPGWTNRILSRLAARVFISFEPARKWFGSAEKKGRVVLAGNPVRRGIREAIAAAGSLKHAAGVFRVLVVGGSQGAHALNVLVPAAFGQMSAAERSGFEVRHQSGAREREAVEAAYRELGMNARAEAFIEDMADAYAQADLVVSRSGAGAVAEIALAGRPAIFIPFPFAASDHQAVNAQALVAAGAALMFREGEVDGTALARTILGLYSDRKKLVDMAAAARSEAKPDAAAVIVDHCVEMMAR